MKVTARAVLGSASVVLLGGVVWLAIAHGPTQGRVLLMGCGVLAVGAAVQSVTAAPKDLTLALFFALFPLMALVSEGSPTWMIGPLGVLLFLAGELNGLSWDARGPYPFTAAQRRRVRDSLILTAAGFAGVAVVGLAGRGLLPGGTWAVALAAVALGALGIVVLGGAKEDRG